MLNKQLLLNSGILQRIYSYSVSCVFSDSTSTFGFWSCAGRPISTANIMGCNFRGITTFWEIAFGDVNVDTSLSFDRAPNWNVEKWGNIINLYREDTGDMRVLTYAGINDITNVGQYSFIETTGGPYFLSEMDHGKTIPIRIEVIKTE